MDQKNYAAHTWRARINGNEFPGLTTGVLTAPSKSLLLRGILHELADALEGIEIDPQARRLVLQLNVREVVPQRQKVTPVTVDFFKDKPPVVQLSERRMRLAVEKIPLAA